MMTKITLFLVRWALTSLGLWIVVRLFGHAADVTLATSVATYLLAGLVFAVINAIIKPLITILSLPFVLLTLGLFMLVINGLMVWLTIKIVPGLQMSFGWAIVGGIVLSLVNYLISNVNEVAESKGGTK
ncbi:phage holin family protein [Candidatus Saccharibacteria bacterium]|nr:phage holin family protein [Candidatus Saccharibacteria bacterium]